MTTETTSEQRSEAQKKAYDEINELIQQLLSGLLMLDEFLNAMFELRIKTPVLQVGDVCPLTGLRLRPCDTVPVPEITIKMAG